MALSYLSVGMNECGMFNVCLNPFKRSIIFLTVTSQVDLIVLSAFSFTPIILQKQTVDQRGGGFQKTFFGIAT